MRSIPEEQRSPEKLNIPHGGNLKVTGTGILPVLKNKLAGKKTILDPQRVFATIKDRLPPWKKGQAKTTRTARIL